MNQGTRVVSAMDVANARAELLRETHESIERATAIKWAARASAAMGLWVETGNVKWYATMVEYAHEAVEHAAVAGDATLDAVRDFLADTLDSHRSG